MNSPFYCAAGERARRSPPPPPARGGDTGEMAPAGFDPE